MSTPTLDPKQIEALMASPIFKQAALEADTRRVTQHKAALAEIAQHETDSAPAIAQARTALEKAEAAFRKIEPGYLKSQAEHFEKARTLADVEYAANHKADILRSRLDGHLPPCVHDLEACLPFVAADLRAAFVSKSRFEPSPFGEGRLERIDDNSKALSPALAALQDIADYCRVLRTSPSPESAIRERLAELLDGLRQAARAVGVEVDSRLPEEFRKLHVERERAGDYRAIYPK